MNFQQLQKRSEVLQNRLFRIMERFPWEDRRAYTSWLAQTYEYVSFGTRILALTAGHFSLEKTPYSNRFIQHAAEEKGHDRLLTNDAKALGEDLSSIPVLPEAEAFHKSIYFWIYQGRPFVVFGFILCLECAAIQSGPLAYERVKNAFGKQAASFLYVHTHEDPDHVQKAFSQIEKLSESDLRDVAHGLELYVTLYENIYRAIEAEVGSSMSRKSA